MERRYRAVDLTPWLGTSSVVVVTVVVIDVWLGLPDALGVVVVAAHVAFVAWVIAQILARRVDP